MDIRINSNTNIHNADFESAQPAQSSKKSIEAPSLSITQASSSAVEDNMGIDVPESALTRTDALGKLISSAFVLAAPPMPDFK
ncbi:MAG: hypothetical protein J6X55_14970 [Victivallales bacterium]|nr:hypothetical protein [Victivallales bacterium]